MKKIYMEPQSEVILIEPVQLLTDSGSLRINDEEGDDRVNDIEDLL